MDRREFLHAGIMASLVGKVLSDVTLAQPPAGQAPATPAPAAAGTAQTPAAPPPPTRRLIMDCYTRNVHWIRDHDQIAEAAIEMTCGGVQPTVQAYPGHIDPTKVATELPAFVKTMQKHGLRVKQIRGGNQTSVDQPNLEPMVAAMGQAGATHYWCGTDNYDLTKPIMPQLDAIKRKVDAFVIYTDSETWAGGVHPAQALRDYRRASGIDARLVVVGMVANDFSIADPSDPGMLDVVGFDTATPQLISDFARGAL